MYIFNPFNKYCYKAQINKSNIQLYQQTHLFMESEKNFVQQIFNDFGHFNTMQ